MSETEPAAPAQSAPQPPAQPAPPPPARPAARASVLALLAVLLAAGLSAFIWYDTRNRIAATEEQLARRLRDIENDARDARLLARQAQEAMREAQGRVGQLESRLAESQSQQLALEALYQELSRNRDEWQLAEIEQILAIASQQLQLAGNVRAALLALQLAEQRLSRADRPQFAPIRRALARDIERLKAAPTVDLPGMSMRLDSVIAAVDELPLAYEERSEPAKRGARPAAPPGEGFLGRLGAEVWHELSQLIVVRKIGADQPPLLPPSQAYFARENLRLRLLNARASLLLRDEAGYREDLRAAGAWIRRYFEPGAKRTVDALAQLKQLSAAELTFEMPSIGESLEAVRAYKSRRERSPG
ncbi:MAG TPA: uroporphyrinogen-III C-methyltransferase [Burkholderiales bacterium]